MNIKKYLTAIIVVLLVTSSCTEDLKNPRLKDSDLKVYFKGVGGSVEGVAWEGYNVTLGKSLTINLQVSPSRDTKVKWVDDATDEVLSENLTYTFSPTKPGLKKMNFFATRPSGFEKKVTFNFRGVLDGYSSRVNSWQSILIPKDVQKGKFVLEFDIIPSKDKMDGIVGVLDGVAKAYSDNSCIVRLNPKGKIDAFNDKAYSADNELTYHAGLTYHIKMEVNTPAMRYNVIATEKGGTPVVIAKNYAFRKKIDHLNYWSIVAGDYNLKNPGTHRILNMTIAKWESSTTTHTVTFKMDGGTPVEKAQIVEEKDKVVRPKSNPTKTGYKFTNWFVSAKDGAVAFDFSSTLITEDIIIYAKFIKTSTPQKTLNLDATTAPRFTVTDLVWPPNVGEADVCLWNNDKIAAFTISIDDNNEADVPFWKNMHSKYGFNFTWFLITEAVDNIHNVQNWSLFNDLASTGNQINGHDDRNWYNTLKDGQTNPTPAEYLGRLQATKTVINTNVTNGNNKCLTYAYPFGEGLESQARTEFIAIRGVNGILNKADEVNYLDVNSISNVHIYNTPANRDKYILPLLNKSSKLYNVNYYRGWGSTHFHHVDAAAQTLTEEFLKYLQGKSNLWVAGFTEVSQYSQEYATHSLAVNQVNTTEIKFTLTDNMPDSAFNYPLTVKVRIKNNWTGATATQNGASVGVQIVTNSGNKYALVKSVPDMGEVTLTGTLSTDPPVLSSILDASMETGGTLKVQFSASNKANDKMTFSVSNLPAFAKLTDNGDNTGHIVFDPLIFKAGVYPNITIIANNGTSTDTKSFKLTVTEKNGVAAIFSDLEDRGAYFPKRALDINGRNDIIAGGGYAKGKQMSAVFPFQLPTKPAGKRVVKAKFIVNLEQKLNANGITGHLNLYGLAHRSSVTIVQADAYAGTYNGDTNATALQESFADKKSTLGPQETTAAGNTNLVSFLNTQYAAAAVDDFIFLRLSNSSLTQGQYSRMIFTSANGAKADNTKLYPTLYIEFGD